MLASLQGNSKNHLSLKTDLQKWRGCRRVREASLQTYPWDRAVYMAGVHYFLGIHKFHDRDQLHQCLVILPRDPVKKREPCSLRQACLRCLLKICLVSPANDASSLRPFQTDYRADKNPTYRNLLAINPLCSCKSRKAPYISARVAPRRSFER